MYFLYNILTYCTGFFIRIVSLFNTKLQLFVKGRVSVFKTLTQLNSENKRVIWVHCASLGEFEQGRPIIERLYQDSNNFIVLSFFSPSGYEIRKNYDKAHHITYLPLDTNSNAKCFIKTLQPDLAIFVKYEFWPNYLRQLRRNNIRTLLVSGIFREKHSFFKNYGGWMRKSLDTFEHFFVQDQKSKALLGGINKTNVTISGDTRFDRVYEILQQNNTLEFIESFKQHSDCIVYGSTWKEDHEVISDFINSSQDIKHIIAPHHIDEHAVKDITDRIPNKRIALFSEKDSLNLEEYDVFIINTIGILTKIYSYADVAYVGGGFKTGLHNTLEPATFGAPILIGPHYSKFNEAIELVELGGIISTNNKEEYLNHIKVLIVSSELRKEKGLICSEFIENKKGATEIILAYLGKFLPIQ
ncbi:MAG: 3-deoxy-D-manno-octulosonic acid transferase [Flavobacteriaceae bacterium]|nr:3-deoxy-D-manno-octulosonic acid transferase [Flavobacteriaceae bacterium]